MFIVLCCNLHILLNKKDGDVFSIMVLKGDLKKLPFFTMYDDV